MNQNNMINFNQANFYNNQYNKNPNMNNNQYYNNYPNNQNFKMGNNAGVPFQNNQIGNNQNMNQNQKTDNNNNTNNNTNGKKEGDGNMVWKAGICAAIAGACVVLISCCLKDKEKKSTLGFV